jgi:Holliday junction resolvasome RuvABC endonuclease subunit
MGRSVIAGQTRVMGIDPGSVSAAYGLIPWDLDGGVDAAVAHHVPVADRMVDGRAFAYIVANLNPTHAAIERVNAFPGQGIASAFRFGQGYGVLQGVLASHGVKIIEVASTVWKKHFRLGPDKEKARALAIQRFPNVKLHLKKDAGRAEALLLALWLRETGQ